MRIPEGTYFGGSSFGIRQWLASAAPLFTEDSLEDPSTSVNVQRQRGHLQLIAPWYSEFGTTIRVGHSTCSWRQRLLMLSNCDRM